MPGQVGFWPDGIFLLQEQTLRLPLQQRHRQGVEGRDETGLGLADAEET